MSKPTPSWKLLVTLGLAGATSGLVLVLAYTWTLPRVQAHEAGEIRAAIEEVLASPTRSDTLYLENGALTATRPARAGEAESKIERVFRGYDASGRTLGYAFEAKGPGFLETIRLMIGYDLQRHALLGMKILDSKETPGIADGIMRPAFSEQFRGANVPVVGVKASPATSQGTVVMVTGATISSRAIIKAINTAVVRWQPLLAQYETTAAASGRE
jgi:electron transport complex protein RnfG